MEQKKLLLSIMVVGMFSSAALAIAPIGPPVAGLAEGQYGVGISYALADLEVKMPDLANTMGRKAVQNAEAQGYFLHVGYGISDEWCAYVSLGMSELEADADEIPVTGQDFNGDAKFTYAVGTKRTLHDNGTDTKWGVALQYMKGGSEDSITLPTSFGNGVGPLPAGGIDIEWNLIQLAVGPAVQVNPDVCLYGGPFLMFIDADAEYTPAGFTFTTEIKEAFELGGYIGTVINLGGSAGLGLEFLFTGQSWGAGIGAMFPL